MVSDTAEAENAIAEGRLAHLVLLIRTGDFIPYISQLALALAKQWQLEAEEVATHAREAFRRVHATRPSAE